jgi:hypothetical protein
MCIPIPTGGYGGGRGSGYQGQRGGRSNGQVCVRTSLCTTTKPSLYVVDFITPGLLIMHLQSMACLRMYAGLSLGITAVACLP